jgi:hypothetical protein
MRSFHFIVDLRCHLVNGEVQMLRNYRVRVEANSEAEARRHVAYVATEKVHDNGGDATDAPLEDLVVISCRAA